jgi:hypothetical protein
MRVARITPLEPGQLRIDAKAAFANARRDLPPPLCVIRLFAMPVFAFLALCGITKHVGREHHTGGPRR